MDAQKALTDELAENHPEAIEFIKANYPTKQRKDENGKVITVTRNPKDDVEGILLPAIRGYLTRCEDSVL